MQVAFTKHRFLAPPAEGGDSVALQAREALEIAALCALRCKKEDVFVRSVAQLRTYYDDYGSLPESSRRWLIVGLCLMRHLANGDLSRFHAELELVPRAQLENAHIKHPVQLERYIAEGGFLHVWDAQRDVPDEMYQAFMDKLMQTLRCVAPASLS